jgi:hypothetical protein
LETFNDEQLDSDITVCLANEYLPAILAFAEEEDNELDLGHPFFQVANC